MMYLRLCALLVALLVTTSSQAQLPQTRLYSVFPPGGQSGQPLDVVVGAGEDLDEVDRLLFSHPGITSVPKTEIPASGAGVAYSVSIAADVPPGLYEVQASGRFGVSNPRRFQVGTHPVLRESEGNNSAPEADELPLDQLLYALANGSADVDWFQVTLKAGQTVVFDCGIERLDSRLIGHLELYDASGRKRLAHVRSLPGRDPVLPFQVPSDGTYLIKIHDVTYRGGNEFGYSLLVRTSPYLDYSIPAAVIAGSNTTVTLFGYNLPGGSPAAGQAAGAPVLQQLDVEVTPPANHVLKVDEKISPAQSSLDAFSYRLPPEQGGSNSLRLGITDAQLIVDQEQPDDPPRVVTLPADISGQFATVGDTDRFRFVARQGETITIDVLGQRLGGFGDPILVVEQVQTSAQGQESLTRVAAVDDEKNSPLPNVFETESNDPMYRLQAPADGTYQITLRDRYWETRGDAHLAYRCLVHFARPDFRLVAVPASPVAGQAWPVGLRRGDNFSVHVLAFRQDGFSAPIDVSATGLPAGVTTVGTVIGQNQTTSMLTFQVGMEAPAGWHPIQLIGTARLEDAAAVAAVTAAKKQLAEVQALDVTQQAKLAALTEKLQTTQTALAQVATAVQGVAIEEPAKKELEAASAQILASLTKAQESTKAEIAATTEKMTAARVALDAAIAQQNSVAKVIEEPVRIGTVLWNSAANVPAISRITAELGLSIISEQAPFQLKTNLQRVEVRPGRQLLLTTQLERRSGFEEVVKLDVQGLPKEANIDFEKGELAKDASSKQLRVFVKENAPIGQTFTAWLSSEGEVNYRRNPERADRLTQAHTAAQQILSESKSKSEQAAKAKTDSEAQLKLVQDQMAAAQTTQQQRQQAFDAVQKEIEAAQAAVTRFQAQATKGENLVAAWKNASSQLGKIVIETAPTMAASAAALEAAGQLLQINPENAEFKQRVAAAQLAFDAANQLTESLRQQAAAATAEFSTLEQSQKAFLDQLAAAQKLGIEKSAAGALAKSALDEAAAAVQKSAAEVEAAKKQVETMTTAEQTAATELKAAEAAEQAAGKAAAEAVKAAEPQKKKFTPPSEPIIFVIKPAPVEIKAEVPNSGAFKPGDTLAVKVKIVRKEGFFGPVRVTLGDIAEGRGVSASEVIISAGADEATLNIAATAEAAEGDVALAVIRTTSEFDGEAIVDFPVVLKVAK